jgi:serine/threonine protein kinase
MEFFKAYSTSKQGGHLLPSPAGSRAACTIPTSGESCMRKRRQKKSINPLKIPVPTITSQQLRFVLDPGSGCDKTLLGQGSFGKVYAAHCQEGAVAVKFLHVSTPQLNQTLYKEAAEVFNAWSSYVVTLYGIYVDGEKIALVMEHMPGGSLFNLLQDDTQDLPWLLRYQIAYEIAEGISSLHQQFIIHGNLKSTNVMLDKDQHVALTNFGFSKSRKQMSAVSDISGHSARTLPYEAPEIASLNLSGATIDDKKETLYSTYSDIYAYGVLLWELATRKVPFEGKDPLTILTMLSQGRTEKIPIDCPVRVAALIKACWAINPKRRPSASDILIQIKALYIDELDSESAKRYIAQEQTSKKFLDAEALKEAVKPTMEEEKGLVVVPLNTKTRKKGKSKLTAKPNEVINECRTTIIAIEAAIEQAEKNAIEQIENWTAKTSLRSLQIKKNVQEAIDKKLSELVKKENSLATEKREEETVVSPSANPRDILEITVLLKRGDQAAVQDKLRINPLLAVSKELFLLFVAAGEQNQAEAMLRANPKLSVAKGTLTDLSGRTFKDITGFQYAIWALDWHMWKMLFNMANPNCGYLSAEQAASQIAALPQGEWVKKYGMHFSFDPLIHALEICLNYYDACSPGEKNTAGDRAWRQQVGGAQLWLPAHVINEYCRPDRSFYPTPDFLDANLPRSMKTDEGFWFTTVYEGGRLGVKFGIYRAGRRSAMISAEEKSFDGQSICVLAKTRLQQYEVLRLHLQQYASSVVDIEETKLALAEMIAEKSEKRPPKETYKAQSIDHKNSQIFGYSIVPAKVNIRKPKSLVSVGATKKSGLFQSQKINGLKAGYEEIESQETIKNQEVSSSTVKIINL